MLEVMVVLYYYAFGGVIFLAAYIGKDTLLYYSLGIGVVFYYYVVEGDILLAVVGYPYGGFPFPSYLVYGRFVKFVGLGFLFDPFLVYGRLVKFVGVNFLFYPFLVPGRFVKFDGVNLLRDSGLRVGVTFLALCLNLFLGGVLLLSVVEYFY